ncbi:hypothetical protein CHUAL_009523 [Chamberlinius hualienensis]
MVPYYEHHETKQFTKGKPDRLTYKLQCGQPSFGYLSWLQPYQEGGTLPERFNTNELGVESYADQLPSHQIKLYFVQFYFIYINLLETKIGSCHYHFSK